MPDRYNHCRIARVRSTKQSIADSVNSAPLAKQGVNYISNLKSHAQGMSMKKSGFIQYFRNIMLVLTVLVCVMFSARPAHAASSFRDVSGRSSGIVDWAVENGITTGTGKNTFSPSGNCTRAQIVTFLCRTYKNKVDGAEISASENADAFVNFKDVPRSKYYYDPVSWAVRYGITSGTGRHNFSPDAVCTRAQAITFLWRCAGSPYSGSKASKIFRDVPVTAYYADAVSWAVSNGITSGTSSTTYSPNQNCTRLQIITFIYRMLNNETVSGELHKSASTLPAITVSSEYTYLNLETNPQANIYLDGVPESDAKTVKWAVSTTENDGAENQLSDDIFSYHRIPIDGLSARKYVSGSVSLSSSGDAATVTAVKPGATCITATYNEKKYQFLVYVDGYYDAHSILYQGKAYDRTLDQASWARVLLGAYPNFYGTFQKKYSSRCSSDLSKIISILQFFNDSNWKYSAADDLASTISQKTGICWECSMITYDFCSIAGIPVETVISPSMNHEWNQVKINGNWVVLDVTSAVYSAYYPNDPTQAGVVKLRFGTNTFQSVPADAYVHTGAAQTGQKSAVNNGFLQNVGGQTLDLTNYDSILLFRQKQLYIFNVSGKGNALSKQPAVISFDSLGYPSNVGA